MKTLLLAVSMTAFSMTSALALDVGGSYKTSEGDMTLSQDGDRISGKYTNDNGEITGTMYDATLDGFWIEDHSDRRCNTSKHGRYYWGRIAFEFSDNAYSGLWGYCNDAPTRPWTGSRTGASSYSGSPVPENSIFIEGVWKSSEGDISFRQKGSKVSGKYAQDNGEIAGGVKENDFDGYWIEDHSDRRCSTQKNGRYFWGKLQLHFEDNRFSGKWGYCDDQPARQWTGQRK
ncbi:MAG: hypothetical protein Q7V04_01755 [Deltaproteobacteria bacterium]|nr:hypothetical protein [Deltaproteobacteria bacterium]